MMLIEIVRYTPTWVWGLLAALVALGLSQVRDREASLGRVIALPLAMLGFSLFGVLSVFGARPLALTAWAAGLALVLTLGRDAVAVRGARWSAATQRMQVPGSWLPLALILGLFAVKYAAGATLALHPALAAEPVFAGSLSFAYGLFSGVFLGRGVSLRALAAQRSALQPA